MKSITGILGLLLFSGSALAGECPNFSGDYIWSQDGGQTLMNAQQSGCEKLDIEYVQMGKAYARPMIFDGVKREIAEFPGSTGSYFLKDQAIHFDESFEVGSTLHLTGKIYLDGNKDLVEETDFIDTNGQSTDHMVTVYHRQ